MTQPPSGRSAALWYADTAQAHAEADARCARPWSCCCGACRAARKDGWAPLSALTFSHEPRRTQ
jgi:hypothetical protein